MRITCPLCGPRDRREFYYYGSDDYLNRATAPSDASGGSIFAKRKTEACFLLAKILRGEARTRRGAAPLFPAVSGA